MKQSKNGSSGTEAGQRVIRHVFIDRLFHWLMAASVLVLLATAYLPVLGVKFAWIKIHWIVGLILTVITILHIVRSILWQDIRSMAIGIHDLKQMLSTTTNFLKLKIGPVKKTAKYSPAQKLMHHVVTLVVLTTIVTGLLMMVKIDTPLWERDPYWLSASAWGLVYVLHDLAALCLITIIMIHIYFALRPEKLMYTRSMILGWISRDEYLSAHDPDRWKVDDDGE